MSLRRSWEVISNVSCHTQNNVVPASPAIYNPRNLGLNIWCLIYTWLKLCNCLYIPWSAAHRCELSNLWRLLRPLERSMNAPTARPGKGLMWWSLSNASLQESPWPWLWNTTGHRFGLYFCNRNYPWGRVGSCSALPSVFRSACSGSN